MTTADFRTMVSAHGIHRNNEINMSPSTSIYRWLSLAELLFGWDADERWGLCHTEKRGSWRARSLLTQVAAVVKRLLGNDVMQSEWHKNTYLSRPQGHTRAAICALLPCRWWRQGPACTARVVTWLANRNKVKPLHTTGEELPLILKSIKRTRVVLHIEASVSVDKRSREAEETEWLMVYCKNYSFVMFWSVSRFISSENNGRNKYFLAVIDYHFLFSLFGDIRVKEGLGHSWTSNP